MHGRRVMTNAIDSLIDGDLPLAVNQATSAAALREYPRAQQTSVGRFELSSSIAVTAASSSSSSGATKSSIGTPRYTMPVVSTGNSAVRSTIDAMAFSFRSDFPGSLPIQMPSVISSAPLPFQVHNREFSQAADK
jgi:hypothetical protein